MAQKLVVPITFKIYQGDALVRTETIAQNVIKIGRDQKSHLRIEDDSVSRMHAVIEAKPEEIQIIDLGSGTLVNGQSVNKCALNSNDEIKIGNTRIVVDIGQAVDEAAYNAAKAPAATPTPSVPPMAAASAVASAPPAFVAPPFAAPIPGLPGMGGAGYGATPPATAGVDGEEIYQLIKRGDINPHEVEEVGQQAVEVSILWKNSILHVAHLDGSKDFLLCEGKAKGQPAAQVLGGGLGVGTALVTAGAASHNYIVGGLGTLLMLAGSGAGIVLDHQNNDRQRDVSRFVVGPEILQSGREVPVVLNKGGGTRFVFLQGSTGEAEIDGVKKSLQDLIAGGQARPSHSAPGAHEIDVRPNGRYKMEVGGLTVMAKVVAPGRRVAGMNKRDPAMLGAGIGSAVAVSAAILAMRFAVADDSGFLSQGNDEDRLNELRAFIARQQERQPDQPPQQNNDDQQEGGTGTRHAGPEGKMGRRDAPSRSARYAIRNNGEPPHLSRQAARDAVANRGIFAALGAPGGGAAGGASGIVSPFGGLTESGMDNQNANGNMTGDTIGDAFGYGGLGATGTGWGGGGTGEGTIGLGNVGTMGHGSGTGTGQGYGAGSGRGLHGRGNAGPLVRAAPPTVAGLLSPEAIRRVVLRNLGQVSHCHEQGLAQNPNLEGRVVIRFIIGGDGTVMGSSVAESSVAVPSVGTCIANAVRRWQFPSPEGGGIVTVNYPFNLQHPE
ncbi:MAG: AgmX/PglI C-terminal domain-containing protein [Thermoanaerobaculia bacterium]